MKKGLFATSFILIILFLIVKLRFILIEPFYLNSLVGRIDITILFGSVLFLVILFFGDFLIKTKIKLKTNTKITFLGWIFLFILISTLAISGIFNYSKKTLDWDSVALYDARAKFIQSGLKFSDMISLSNFDNKNKYYYLLYPPFTSIIHSIWYQSSVNIPVGFIYFIMLCVLAVGSYFFALDYLGMWLAIGFSGLVISNKDIFSTSLIEYTNLPFTMYLVIGIFLFVYFLKSRRSWAVIAGAILIGASSWIRYLEPVWFCVLLSLVIYFIKMKLLRKNLIPIIFLVLFVVCQYLSWGYFQNSIAATPKIFFVTPRVVTEAFLGIFSGAFINLSIFFVKALGLVALVHFSALLKIDRKEPSEFLFLRLVIIVSLAMYFAGLYGMAFLFDWWGELGGSLVRSSTFLIPVSIFLTVYNVKYILQREIKIKSLKELMRLTGVKSYEN